MERHRVKSEGRLSRYQVNQSTDLSVKDWERPVETGETRWKRVSNLLEIKEEEQMNGI